METLLALQLADEPPLTAVWLKRLSLLVVVMLVFLSESTFLFRPVRLLRSAFGVYVGGVGGENG